MSMIERVARAICWANGMDPDLTLGGDGKNFLWREYVSQARAAIEAMREPTKAMTESGAYGSGEDSENAALGAWGAMIAAALSEEGE